MRRKIRLFREKLIIKAYKLKSSAHPIIWLILFLIYCLMIPLAASIELTTPGKTAIFNSIIETAHQSPILAIKLTLVAIALLTIPTHIINGAFISLRAVAGYETQQNGTIKAWLKNSLYRYITNRWRR